MKHLSYRSLALGLIAGLLALLVPLSAVAQSVFNYPLLFNATGTGLTFYPVGGNYSVTVNGTFNGATATLTGTVDGLVVLSVPFTAPSTGPTCVSISSKMAVSMVITGGPPTGLNSTLGGAPGCQSLSSQGVNFDIFAVANGCAPDNTSDCSAAINAYYTWVCAQAPIGTLVNGAGHVFIRPKLFVTRGGVYKFTGTINPVMCQGAGIIIPARNVIFNLNTTTPLFQAGPFQTSPDSKGGLGGGTGSYFNDIAAGYVIDGLQCVDDRNPAQLSRVAICVQDNGSGGALVRLYRCTELKGCYLGMYGCDLSTVRVDEISYTDYGTYFGPGCQQDSVEQTHYGPVYYAATIEGATNIKFDHPDFNQCGNIAGTTIHTGWCLGLVSNNTATIFGVTNNVGSPGSTTPGSNYNMDVQLQVDNPWFETRNNQSQPLYLVRCTGDQTNDVYRGLTINNSTIVAGGTNVTGSAWIGTDTGMHGCFNVFVNTATLVGAAGGEFDSYFFNVRAIYHDVRCVNGCAALAVAQSADPQVANYIDTTAYTSNISCPTSGYYPRGTISKVTNATVATGHVQWGCYRVTNGVITGSTNTLNTDWIPVFGTTTDATDKYRVFTWSFDPANANDPLNLRKVG